MKNLLPQLLVLIFIGGWIPQSLADYHDHDDDDHQHRIAHAPILPAYQQECGSCHMAFPAGMLPAASWARLMSGLGKHFGTDAEVDAANAKPISRWLQANAHKRAAAATPAEDRITRTAWFEHKHHDVPASYWKRAAIKSPSNCTACHSGAPQGDFDEHRVRIPH